MIKLTHEINGDRSVLTLRADTQARQALEELYQSDPENFGSISSELEALEWLLGNSELTWIDPVFTGDLTDAPLLGIEEGPFRFSELPQAYLGTRFVGRFGEPVADRYNAIVERWGFEPYALRSFLSDLLAQGEVNFTNHW